MVLTIYFKLLLLKASNLNYFILKVLEVGGRGLVRLKKKSLFSSTG